ncbi:MAG TPA: type I-E CRISPR-associated endonuclease Cas1e [Ktedonobacterales bacterium]|nr:type I-E CRISPR-associated endonuclease Cas1e [Ktedonobacterales bacterium]
MPMRDLHLLPKIRDSWSYLYLERCQIDQEAKAIATRDLNGTTSIPIATLALLMLGPGTSITHAAIRTLADNGCSIVWVGEAGVRCYAQGLGETRSAQRLLRQAQLWSDPEQHLAIVRRMYQMRFPELLPLDLTLQQIRGKEGVRVREIYAQASRTFGVAWTGRSYQRADWYYADPVNRALSAANSCLYGICHAAILSAGYSPALGFIHTGKQLSFVYDVADLYKTELTIPAAFAAVAEDGPGLESRVRHKCRDLFHEHRLLARIVADLRYVLNGDETAEQAGEDSDDYASDDAIPGGLWDPDVGVVPGGVDHSMEPSDESATLDAAKAEERPGERAEEGQESV